MQKEKQSNENIFTGKETKLALERLFKFCKLSRDSLFLDLSSDHQMGFLRNILLNREREHISRIIIYGNERNLDSFEKKFGKSYLKIKLLTELCQEYYCYLSIPFGIEELKESNEKTTLRKNPFLNLGKIYIEFKKLFSNKTDYETYIGRDLFDFFIKAGESLAKREDPRARQIEYHGKEGEAPKLENKFLLQIFDLVYANILHSKDLTQFNILWVDNNPERELSAIDERFEGFIKASLRLEELLFIIEKTFENYSFYIYDNKKDIDAFKILKKYLETQGKGIPQLFVRRVQKKEYEEIALKDFDFILIDIFLGEEFDGVDLLRGFTIYFPEIPAFILSVSDDHSTIASSIKEGADYYILKNQIFSIPYSYYQYIDEIGKILSFLKKQK